MILTLTMNPSIDMAYSLDTLKIDQVNRASEVIKTAGGKGLNVTRVIKMMGRNVTATGYNGGNLGAFLEKKLDDDGIQYEFVKINDEIRNSIAIIHDNGMQTEILEPGPTINKEDKIKFLEYFKKNVSRYSVVTISGSLPKGLDTSFYSKIIEIADKNNVKILLDTSGEALKESLIPEKKPFLIKPNEAEISQLLDAQYTEENINYDSLKEKLQNDMFKGIEWIVVSLGAQGAFVKVNGDFYKAIIPSINVVSPVGSGDSTLAGLAIGIDEKMSIEDTIKTAMTTGMLNTMSSKTGYIDKSKFDEYFKKVKVEEY
ncbi:hexose kinase [Companilactobacillus sp. DQM5]|uniref:hexose kinase n=1 Tax=Companilactobacillus sp. DQM5 TaxID=3463359 RepID=UPI004059A877